jgi:hypothetical protein
MKLISLTQGLFAQVSDKDYAHLNTFKWCAHKVNNTYYAERATARDANGKQRMIKMHRVIMDVTDGRIKVDHINGDGLDNQRPNLRVASTSQNGMNRRKHKTATSIYKGVCWHIRDLKWVAQIKADGRYHSLGYYDNEREAAEAYDSAAQALYGQYASLNFPQEMVNR